MNKSEQDINDLKMKAPLLASLQKSNAFSVPASYFENLTPQIINQIKINERIAQALSFEVPTDYFKELEDRIWSNIKFDEQKEPFLNEHGGFTVPENYFFNSEQEIKKSISIKQANKAKIFNLNFVRYAAAACILLSTSFGIYLNIEHTKSIHYQLSKINDDDIANYLRQTSESSDVPLILENLDDKPVFSLKRTQLKQEDINNYLESTPL